MDAYTDSHWKLLIRNACPPAIMALSRQVAGFRVDRELAQHSIEVCLRKAEILDYQFQFVQMLNSVEPLVHMIDCVNGNAVWPQETLQAAEEPHEPLRWDVFQN